MLEKDIQTLFNKWLAANWRWWDHNNGGSSAFELKLVKHPDKSFNFKKLEKHQENGLLMAKEMVIWKLSDADPRQKPFDSFVLGEAGAYVGICFYKSHKNKMLYLIDIDKYIRFRDNQNKKSVNEKECYYIADFKINLNNTKKEAQN
jgi:hypothetical protein